MDAYVFLAMSICEIGGSEQYIYNKMRYLESIGFDVYVFSGLARKIMIEEFEKYKEDIIPNIMYFPFFYTVKERERIISRIIKRISVEKYENIIIESDGIDEAIWGELLASRINCKHIVFDVQETHDYTDEEVKFYNFKLSRKELFGITGKSVQLMLKDDKNDYSDAVFDAYCNNVVFDCDSNIVERIKPATFTLGSIGRLEKAYVSHVIDEMCQVARDRCTDTFNIVLIGGSNEKSIIDNITKKVSEVKNVDLYITGPLYPIPRKLIQAIDVFVSTSGSASVSYMECKPTIKVHPVSGLPCGIIGDTYNYHTSNMYEIMYGTDVHNLIEDLLDGKIHPLYDSSLLVNYVREMRTEFDRQLEIAKIFNPKVYYDVSKLKKRKKNFKNFSYNLLGVILGGTKMQVVLERMRKLFK